MTLRQIVMELIARGHKVNYYVRKDGGLVIHSIDGTHYSGKTGNAVARKMLGVALSTRRKVQLERINTQRNWKKSKTPIPEDLDKYRLKVNRLLRKSVKVGTLSKRNLREMIEERGVEGAWEYLKEQERRARGLAYNSVINGLLARLEEDKLTAPIEEQEKLESLIEDIRNNMDNISFDSVFRIFDELYNYEMGQLSIDTLVSRVRSILKI